MKYIKLFENFDCSISEGILYHIQNNISIVDNVFRHGSIEYFSLFEEARKLYLSGQIDVHEDDRWVLEELELGKIGIYKGRSVWLDCPFEMGDEDLDEAEYKGNEVELNKPKRGGRKKYYVYVKNKSGNVIKLAFGDAKGGLTSKINDPEARTNFAKRHNCESKNDKTTAGYWSCRLPRFAKQLGLKATGAKWW